MGSFSGPTGTFRRGDRGETEPAEIRPIHQQGTLRAERSSRIEKVGLFLWFERCIRRLGRRFFSEEGVDGVFEFLAAVEAGIAESLLAVENEDGWESDYAPGFDNR